MKKALIVKKEWLDLILSGKKTIEIRGSNSRIRGEIGLIESKSGLIVGSCCIVDSILVDDNNLDYVLKHSCIDSVESLKNFYSKQYAWKLESAKRFEQPIKYNHPKGAIIWIDLSKQKLIF